MNIIRKVCYWLAYSIITGAVLITVLFFNFFLYIEPNHPELTVKPHSFSYLAEAGVQKGDRLPLKFRPRGSE